MGSTTVRIGNAGTRVTVAGGNARRVVLDQKTVATINGHRPVVVIDPASTPVHVDQRDTVVRAGSAMGVQGPPGEPGSVAVIELPVGAMVQGLRMVRSHAGVAWPVDTDVEDHAAEVIGLALQSVTSIGTAVRIQPAGRVTEAGWSWVPGVVWCGADGALTQSPAATGWLLQVARVVSPTSVDIDIEQPIYRG